MSLVMVDEVSKIYGNRGDTLVGTALEAVSLSIDPGDKSPSWDPPVRASPRCSRFSGL